MTRAPSNLPEALAELAQLRRSHELLVSTLDAAGDGILTLLHADGSICYNIRFIEMWDIPEDKLGDISKASLIELMLSRVKDPAGLAARIEQRSLNPEAEDLSTIEMKDGRVLERHVTPQRIQSQCVGSLVTFRDVTERVRYEGKMRFSSLVVEHSGPMMLGRPGARIGDLRQRGRVRRAGVRLRRNRRSAAADIVDGLSPELSDAVAAKFRDPANPTFEHSFRRKNGTLVQLEVTIVRGQGRPALRGHRRVQGHYQPETSRAGEEASASDPAVADQFHPRPDLLQGRSGPLPGLQYNICRRGRPGRQ